MELLQKKIEQLGFTPSNGLHLYEKKTSWSDLSPRVRHTIDIIEPYAFFCIDQKPFILFFDYSLKSEHEKKRLNIKVWNSQTPVVIIEDYNHIEIKNGFLLDRKKEELSTLTKKENIDLFSFWNIASGRTWESFEKEFKKKKLDDYLLENIKTIINNLYKTDSKPFANSLVLRLIFIRYLIDREIEIDFDNLNGNIDRETARQNLVNIVKSKEQLYALFNYLKRDAFNGDLFELYTCPETEKDETDIISQEVLDGLSFFLSGSDVKNRQFVLFDLYDFNIIPVELISNIYERFLGAERQKKDGAFYTPPFLVDYILKNTITPYLTNSKECCILDPACGSGIFLVEALRLIIENNLGGRTYFEEEENEELKSYLVKNIFGIDKNREALEVAVFSLYITLLDYKNPKKLKGFTFPDLIKNNFLAENFFNVDVIEEKISEKNFQFIIGNPPWGSYSSKGDFHTEYVDTVNKKYKESKGTTENLISDYQIAQSYLHHLKKIVSKDTGCALILTSKILYNGNAKNFRLDFLLSECKISKVMELSPVRHQIYNKAVGPSAILFFHYDNTSVKPDIEYISLKPNIFFRNFKIIVQEAFDKKTIPTKLFIENDWAWKVFLYGNILDFYFLKRLKSETISFPTINDIIDKYNLLFGVGVQIGGGEDNDCRHLKGMPFLDTKDTDDFERYYVKKTQGVFNYDTIHRPRPKKEEIFKAPFLLIKKGVSSADFKSCAAYYEENLVFTDAVTSIKGSDKDIDLLRNLVGVINSDLFIYYLLMTASSIGIEREQAHNEEERFTFPTTIDKSISKNVKEIELLLQCKEQINNELHELLANNLLLDSEVNLKKLSFDNEIHKIDSAIISKEQYICQILKERYEIDEIENDIIDYALNISIPILKNNSEPLQRIDDIISITPYINVFTDYFDEIFDGEEKYFQVNIYTNINDTDFLVTEFNIVNEAPLEQISFMSTGKYSYNFITKFSINKHTRFFYEQKDIIGFEPTSFYIIKPNEYKNWHPAVAHLDLGKVVESIFKSVKKENNEL